MTIWGRKKVDFVLKGHGFCIKSGDRRWTLCLKRSIAGASSQCARVPRILVVSRSMGGSAGWRSTRPASRAPCSARCPRSTLRWGWGASWRRGGGTWRRQRCRRSRWECRKNGELPLKNDDFTENCPWKMMISPWKTMISPWKTMISPWKTMIFPWKTMISPWKTMIFPWNCLNLYNKGRESGGGCIKDWQAAASGHHLKRWILTLKWRILHYNWWIIALQIFKIMDFALQLMNTCIKNDGICIEKDGLRIKNDWKGRKYCKWWIKWWINKM